MKYSTEVFIDLRRDRVVELFDNPDNLAKWQPVLKSFEYFEGDLGMAGAESRMGYDINGQKLEMPETILKRNLPDEVSGTYEAKGVMHWVCNYFHEEGPDGTRWALAMEFKLSGFMSGSFPKDTLTNMYRIEEFSEGLGQKPKLNRHGNLRPS